MGSNELDPTGQPVPQGGFTVGAIVGLAVGLDVGGLVSVVGAIDVEGLIEGATSKKSMGCLTRSTAHLCKIDERMSPLLSHFTLRV